MTPQTKPRNASVDASEHSVRTTCRSADVFCQVTPSRTLDARPTRNSRRDRQQMPAHRGHEDQDQQGGGALDPQTAHVLTDYHRTHRHHEQQAGQQEGIPSGSTGLARHAGR
jgi:hypothetical protein